MSGAEGRLLGRVRAEPAPPRGARGGALGCRGGQGGGALGPTLPGGEEDEGKSEKDGTLRGLLERGAAV